jgi:uncharacterized protein
MHGIFELYGSALAGGALIGLAASLVLLFQGRVAGVVGMYSGLFLPGGDVRLLRVAFLVGLVLGGGLVTFLISAAPLPSEVPALPLLAAAGLLTGYGAQLGNGCTSGHGVCGVARFSLRSLVATATFIATGMLTVAAVRALGAG